MSRSQGPQPGWNVLVTGASSGLGRALALELAKLGCSLVLTGRQQKRLKSVAEECRQIGVAVVWVAADLAAEGGPEGLLKTVQQQGWDIDALVNNAGAGHAGRWAEGSAQTDRRLARLLVDAPLVLTRGLLPTWKLKGRGALLNVASTGAFQPGPQTAVYYACKAFLASWSLALAREERSWLVVTTLCPGAMKTGFSQEAGKKDVPAAPGPEKTARIAINAWKRRRGLLVPGLLNKTLVFFSRLLPPRVVAAGVEILQRAVKSGQ